MKKYLFTLTILFFLLLGTGCAGNNEVMDFDINDIENIEVYQYSVPTQAKKKTVTEIDDIETIVNSLSKLKIKGDGVNADPVDGGAIQFVFNQSDGNRFTLSYNGVTILTSSDDWYEVNKKNNLFSLWGEMKYDEQDVYEYELPFFPQNTIPHMGLQFISDGECYNTNAVLGTYNWSYDNKDGTVTNVTADSPHPLDIADASEITIFDDVNEIKLMFSLPPDSYTVRYWDEKYIGDSSAYEQYYETANISNDIINLTGNDNIYEIHAIWPQGDAYYFFYIKNDLDIVDSLAKIYDKVYVTKDEESMVILEDDNKFIISGNIYVSYSPRGTYTIKENRLYLTVIENEEYVFLIENDKLIFESGKWLENWVELGTEFLLRQ